MIVVKSEGEKLIEVAVSQNTNRILFPKVFLRKAKQPLYKMVF